jgi:hypothetical protein
VTGQRTQPTPPSRVAVIGGWLLVAGCVLLLIAIVIAAAGGAVTIGSNSVGGSVLTLAVAGWAGGFAMLALAGPSSIGGMIVRIGLALLAIGLGAALAASLVAGSMTTDPLEEGAFVLPFFAGGLATIVGIPVTVVGLLLRAGAPRRVAAAFLGGLVVIVAGGMISSALLSNDPGAATPPLAALLVSGAGLGLVLLSVAGMGVTAIRGTDAASRAAGQPPFPTR